MRTTIQLDDALLAEVKKVAAETGRTFTAVVECALWEVVARHKPSRPASKPKFTTFRGEGLQPGIDLDNSVALLELMERSR